MSRGERRALLLGSLAIGLMGALIFTQWFGMLSAHATASDATDRPEIWYPLPERSGHTNLVIASRHAHGLRSFAREVDRDLPGVRIFMHGCSAHPLATCIRVKDEDLGSTGILAQTEFDDAHRTRWIALNPQFDNARFPIMCHEFGHALGLDHHLHHGVTGAFPDEVHLSSGERRVLRAEYHHVAN